MTRDLDLLLEAVPGFGRCFAGRCRYVDSGSPAICSACAARSVRALPPVAERCPVCDRPLAPQGGRCQNYLCNHARAFERNYAVAAMHGPLAQRIKDYKFEPRRPEWAPILARVLLGFFDDNASVFRRYDLILSSPKFLGPDGRGADPIREIMHAAELSRPRTWPFDLAEPPAVVKTAATRRLSSTSSIVERLEVKKEIHDALVVTNATRTRGRRIVVLDDVFTTGSTLDAVASVLRSKGGAAAVVGVTLARQMGADDYPAATRDRPPTGP